MDNCFNIHSHTPAGLRVLINLIELKWKNNTSMRKLP